MIINLVRHGESAMNAGETDITQIPEKDIPLTDKGHAQAADVGKSLRDFIVGDGQPDGPDGHALVYCSPYKRAEDTLRGILWGGKIEADERPRIYYDPQIRELDHGYQDVDGIERQMDLRDQHGRFYYRFQGGQAPADIYPAMSSFLGSLFAQTQRKQKERVLIVTHSITMRVLVTRFFHLHPFQYDLIKGPSNCAVVTIAPRSSDYIGPPAFTTSRWGVWGLKLRPCQETPDPDYNFGRRDTP